MPIAAFTAVKNWAPFDIDALGIVTLLGAEEMDIGVGQLTRNTFTECLPLLGAHVVANNRITQPIPGFTLYNITDKIVATDVSGWFARWLICQNVTYCSTTIDVKPIPFSHIKNRQLTNLFSFALGSLTPLLTALSCLVGDWWGFVNSIASLVSVLVRKIVVGSNRRALDRAVGKGEEMSQQQVKVLVHLPGGHVVTIRTTRGILLECLLTTPRPLNPFWYNATRAAGWAAFGIHIISLGMASLFCQLYTVLLLVLPTVLVARHIGTECSFIGQRLFIKRTDAEVPFRAAMYAQLDLTPTEEESLRSNTDWWTKYHKVTQEGDFSNWNQILAGS
ncbi:unnamed protein product [Clonostachys rosea]|uniref:Uncharacterized protein n=1 Tax=Bionectria ochroleuca TaxID=29856 RepID=A0ABY6TPM8_BIOOC|nr:unnamed protein product [Clonostachys rosea]